MAGMVGPQSGIKSSAERVIGNDEAEVAAVKMIFDKDIAEITGKYSQLIPQVESLKTKYASKPDQLGKFEAKVHALKKHQKAAGTLNKKTHEEGHQINAGDIERLAKFQDEIEDLEEIFESKENPLKAPHAAKQ